MTPHDAVIDHELAHENAERGALRRLMAWNVESPRREVAQRPDIRAPSIGARLGDYVRRAVFAFDRAGLAVPGLRRSASQVALVARR